MIINTNTGANTAARFLASNTSALQKSLQRLSTGSKITSSADDAAGLAVADRLNAEVMALKAAGSNLGNAISFSQTQDGYIEKISGALERMGELAMLSMDTTKDNTDRALYQLEYKELASFIDSVESKTFNDQALFSANGLTISTGINSSGAAISYATAAVNLSTGAYNDLNAASSMTFGIGTVASAATALSKIHDVQALLATDRAEVGSNLARLEAERSSISILRNNLAAARSRIIDVDVAEESANFAKQQILVQSGTAMLAQANILPQSALRLIS